MLKQLNKRLRERAVVTAAILSMFGSDVSLAAEVGALGGADTNDNRTESPIKHVIILMGENRTFDHIFATYQPRHGQHADNLLSKGIIDVNGNPGPNYAKAAQNSATVNNFYSNSPGGKAPYTSVQTPGTSYAFKACYTNIEQDSLDGPGCVVDTILAAQADYGLLPQDLPLLTEGATGLSPGSPDTRIRNATSLPVGPYPVVTQGGTSLYDTYGGSPVHRFYQMWQELDCDITKAKPSNPSGCQADLFTFVEQTVSSGSHGKAPPSPPPTPLLKEGDIALGFYNVAKGDAPYFVELARKYTLNDNYHQPVMGGTFANQMMFGYADALYYSDVHGNPATPPSNQIENPNPMPGTNNWYTQDGYSGGSYTNCSDSTQPGVAPIVSYLQSLHVHPNCAPHTYYLLNNYVPAYIGSGETDPVNNGPFTLPPVKKQRHIGDVLSAAGVSWAYFGERWDDFK